MKGLAKACLTCFLVLAFSTGIFAVNAQRIDTDGVKGYLIAAEEQKKPEEPGSKPSGDEEEGGCKC